MSRSRKVPCCANLLLCPQATYYQDCDRTLLVFFWSHTLCDFEGGMAFLKRWLRGCVTASGAFSCTDTAIKIDGDGVAVVALGASAMEKTASGEVDIDTDAGLWRFERVKYYGRPSAATMARLAQPGKSVGAAGSPSLPSSWTAAVGEGGKGPTGGDNTDSSSGGSSISSSVQQACREWLATTGCPFMVCSTITQSQKPGWLIELSMFR
jgi:hypothetical protein